ncbi:MAG: YeeE/YedE family protein, partial [Bacteroidales bacterium]|nr:YeeE/YedE family protein [Bacteroidales bacterium]
KIMGPLYPLGIINENVNLLIAFFIGIVFGAMLEAAGFTNTRKLAGVFYGYDFVVLQVFFTAAITAAIGLLFFEYFGWIDLSDIWVNRFYTGSAILGGALMGIGFVIGGFCPGTSACASAIGKIDAMLFLGGFIVGVILFDAFYPLYSGFYKAGNQGPVKIYESLGMNREVFLLLFVIVAIASFVVTGYIQQKISHKSKKY